MKLKAGELNQRIELYRFEDVDDGAGGSYPQSILYWATSAKVIEVKSSRTLEASQEKLKPVFDFVVRYRNDKEIIPDMTFKWRGQWFRINQVSIDYVFKESITFRAISDTTPIQ